MLIYRRSQSIWLPLPLPHTASIASSLPAAPTCLKRNQNIDHLPSKESSNTASKPASSRRTSLQRRSSSEFRIKAYRIKQPASLESPLHCAHDQDEDGQTASIEQEKERNGITVASIKQRQRNQADQFCNKFLASSSKEGKARQGKSSEDPALMLQAVTQA